MDGNSSYINWQRLRSVIHTATYMLDDIINVNRFPIPELKKMSDLTRKTGLGVMGFARMLFKLGVAYGSPEASQIAAQIMSFLDYESKTASVELSILRGEFPARSGHGTESNAFFKRICDERQVAEGKHERCEYSKLAGMIATYGIRNSNTTTIAPTGTLSIIADTSGGCEPVFALAFTRRQAGMVMQDADPVFEAAMVNTFGSTIGRAVIAGVAHHHGSLQKYVTAMAQGYFDAGFYTPYQHDQLADLAKVFVTAHDLSPTQHVMMQAAFQRFNDSAVSKSVNHDNSATVEDIEAAYLLAYETGCKGITVYRDGCRQFQPLSTTESPVGDALLVVAVVALAGQEDACPNEDCGLPLRKQEGCSSCVCGYSACSVG